MSGALAGKVVALIGEGSSLDRSLAIACAEAGADLALATVTREATQEFAMNSIANEAWALDREQFVTLLDAADPTQVLAFAEQVADRYRRCAALIAAHYLPSTAPLDELSPDEWQATLQTNLTAPFLAAPAFGLVMERLGGGVILLVSPQLPDADAAYRAARAGLAPIAAAINETWAVRGIRAHVLDLPANADPGLLALAALASAGGATPSGQQLTANS